MKVKKRYIPVIILLILVFAIIVSSNHVLAANNKLIKITYIDVGQADSILIQQDKASMLIDAGNNDDSSRVISYIKSQGIKKLDYVIGTHPHEDHIGGLDDVISNFSIGKIYMPKVLNTTKTFKDVLNAVENKKLKIATPVPGTKFKLGTAVCTILAPNGNNYEDLNNYSIVIKVVYGKNKFLFQGDAEALSEAEILKKGFDISADVIKVGHHGSNSSTSSEYLNKVNPKYAIISVGKANDYGHPHKETIDRLKEHKINVYRTDERGNIIAQSDGKKISFSFQKSKAITNDNKLSSSTIVYITKSGKAYHANGCKALLKSKIPISLSEAKSRGYTPCKMCNPKK